MKTRTWAGVAIAAALALGLAGCGPDHGTVHDKSHSDGYFYTSTSCYGKPVMCYPQTHYMPPSWSLDVWASEDDHGWVSVSSGTYGAYEIGDYYDARGDR